jgi:dTDP-4-dehydrorhamnose reductase
MGLGTVVTTSRDGTEANLRMDLSQSDEVRQVVRQVQPQLIVNAAAYTAVDRAESEPKLAMAVNGIAPGVMAEEAKRCGAGIIHYSTDYVFDGTKQTPYVETDVPNPLNVYGKTKLAGEQAIQTVDVPHLIFRTSWVYGLRGKNFLLTMLRLAQEREEIQVVDDQIGSPTWCGTIAQVTTAVLAHCGNGATWSDRRGVYHLSSTGETSWYGFASAIFELSQGNGSRKLKSVVPISSAHYPSPVQRPSYSLLDVNRLSQTFGVRLPSWREALTLALNRPL